MAQEGIFMCYSFQSLFCKLSLYYISTVTIIFVSISVYQYIYIYIYIQRERERERDIYIYIYNVYIFIYLDRQIDRQIDRQYIKVASGVLIPLIVDSSLYIAYSPLFQILSTPLPFSSLLTPSPHCPFQCLISLTEWV